MKTTENNVRQRLKVETATAHKRLDDMMGTRGPFDTSSNYHWYLSGMRMLYRDCLPSIRWAEQEVGLELRKPSLIELIDSDLATLRAKDGASALDESLLNAAEQEFDAASHWARAYVMEGSAIGASFMIRGARAKLMPEVGCAFLTQLASDAKDRWPKFVAALAESDVDANQAVSAACDVFDLATEIFSTSQAS